MSQFGPLVLTSLLRLLFLRTTAACSGGNILKKKWWLTWRSVNYVVLTRLSSFLMAANRKKTKGKKLVTILISSAFYLTVSYFVNFPHY